MAKISVVGKRKSYEIDMCRGPLASQMITFAIPLMISNVLQLLFHAADLIVVGRFASYEALAAIGATGSLTNLLINIFVGLSIGTNVLVARYLGEKKRRDISRTVHTAVMTSLIGGSLLAVISIGITRPVLMWMDTPLEIIDDSVLYMSIYFGGMPVIMLYNFGSAILRAMGDTTRPFYFLFLAGIINVLLNLFFVLVFKWDVAGVATATIVSKGIAAALVLRVLYKLRGPCRVKWQLLHIEWKNLREMMWIGIPAGFQSSCFSLSNVLIQSSINSFGSAAMAGSVAYCSVENFGHTALDATAQTVISFVSRNYGGKQYDRMKQSIRFGLFGGVAITFFWGMVLLIFGRQLLSIFNTDPEVINWGLLRSYYIAPMFFIAGIMQINTGAMRGLGYSIAPSLMSIFSVCVFRVIWIFTVFRWYPTMEALLINYPVSWLINAIGVTMLLKATLRKVLPKQRNNTISGRNIV